MIARGAWYFRVISFWTSCWLGAAMLAVCVFCFVKVSSGLDLMCNSVHYLSRGRGETSSNDEAGKKRVVDYAP